jgi:DNA-binding transcriptional ArsR family regulator
MRGDADIASVARLAADPGRARILLALADGRALPASVLADEAGVAPSTTSAHLGKLIDGGMLSVERHGRHRYFRLTGTDIAEMIEALARISPSTTVRSLRQGTKAQAIRFARTCYDHLAGRLGTDLMAALIAREVLTGGNGALEPRDDGQDRLAAPGFDLDYQLTSTGLHALSAFGIDFDALPRRRPLIRYCVDWSEQRHHLAGALGAALADRLFELDWLRRARGSRAVRVTETGYTGLGETFGLRLSRP